MRWTWAMVVVSCAGCSFLDDFDEFRVAKSSPDASPDGASDGGADDGDGGSTAPCAAGPDGTPCGSGDGFVCIAGGCRVSACGDGYIDEARGEACEDENTYPGDGCEPGTCTLSCTENADCDNGFVCDGEETCDDHRCTPGSHVDDVACQRFDGVAGACAAGYCVPPGCGDGTRDASEECDGEPGCRPDCTMGCSEDRDCPDGNLCDGIPKCVAETGECTTLPAVGCDDGDPCTLDRCHPLLGCTAVLDDEDGDGYAAQRCAGDSSNRGGDCDDDNLTVYPGATEYCDALDNDCDEMTDESSVMATCYRDDDGDGFPIQADPVVACTCPRGTMPERTDQRWDCWDERDDGGRDVFPGQTEFFAVGYNRRCRDDASPCEVLFDFDYDCDGTDTPFYTVGSVTSCGALGGALGCSPSGYMGAPPTCGDSAAYLTCTPNGGLLGGCSSSTLPRGQLCR